MIPDLQGKTVLHNCIEKSYARAADSILMVIGKAPLDDHIIFIQDAIPDLLALCPVSLAKYFEMRVIKPPWGLI